MDGLMNPGLIIIAGPDQYFAHGMNRNLEQ